MQKGLGLVRVRVAADSVVFPTAVWMCGWSPGEVEAADSALIETIKCDNAKNN